MRVNTPNGSWVEAPRWVIQRYGNRAGSGIGIGKPQSIDATNLAFRVQDPSSDFGEIVLDHGNTADRLAGTAKVGAWTHPGRPDDPRRPGQAFAYRPRGTGVPRRLRGDSVVYLILDQLLYRPAGRRRRGVRPSVLSPPDRNLIDLYADAGVSLSGLVPGRPFDTFGAAVADARISGPATALDVDVAQFSGQAYLIRFSEVALQPTDQYIVRPGGGIQDPFAPGTRTDRRCPRPGVAHHCPLLTR